jgi:hypothetical protein
MLVVNIIIRNIRELLEILRPFFLYIHHFIKTFQHYSFLVVSSMAKSNSKQVIHFQND